MGAGVAGGELPVDWRWLQGFTYRGPSRQGCRTPGVLPEQYNRPTTSTITHHHLGTGEKRTVTEGLVFDVFGRLVSQTAADGTITATVYDGQVPVGGVLPVGLPVTETVTAPDGLVAETRYQLNEARTAPVVVETYTGNIHVTDEVGGVVWVRAGRVEFEYTNPVPFAGVASVQRRVGVDGVVETTTRHLTVAWTKALGALDLTLTPTTKAARFSGLDDISEIATDISASGGYVSRATVPYKLCWCGRSVRPHLQDRCDHPHAAPRPDRVPPWAERTDRATRRMVPARVLRASRRVHERAACRDPLRVDEREAVAR